MSKEPFVLKISSTKTNNSFRKASVIVLFTSFVSWYWAIDLLNIKYFVAVTADSVAIFLLKHGLKTTH